MVTITPRATGQVVYDKLACKSTYPYVFLKDTTVTGGYQVTDYRWAYAGPGKSDTLRGPNLQEISVTWDTNQVARFKLVAYTTTVLGETCHSDTIRFEVKVNQRRGLTPTGPDTLCHDPKVALLFRSADSPRTKWQWVYSPTADGNLVGNQDTSAVKLLVPKPGRKTIKVGPYIDTTAGVCYIESPTKTFVLSAAPADSITLTGTQAICDDPELTYLATNFVGSSTIKWGFDGPNTASQFVNQTKDSARIKYNVGALRLGRGLYYVTGQEISRDGCPGPVQKLEVFNDCIPFPNLVTSDGNQDNEVFKVPNIERYPDNTLEVVNRWGRQIYKTSGYKNADFPKLEAGSYYYFFRVNGYHGRSIEQKGWFDVSTK